MELDEEFLKQVIETFRTELEEQSQAMIDGLLKIEANDRNSKVFIESINRIFRAAHNIKGAARGIGVSDVGDISHKLESLFLSIQKGTVEGSQGVINLCLSAIDSMRIALDVFVEKKQLPFELSTILHNLQQASEGKPVVVESRDKKKKAEAMAQVKDMAKEPPAKTDVSILKEIPVIKETPIEKESLPCAWGDEEEEFGILDILAIKEKPEEGLVAGGQNSSEKKLEEKFEQKQEEKEAIEETSEESFGSEPKDIKRQRISPTGAEDGALKISGYESIRVSLYNLDRVSAYMEEMQINKIAIDDHYVELVKLNTKAKQFSEAWTKSIKDLIDFFDKKSAESLRSVFQANAERLLELTSTINKMHKNMNAHINELTVVSNALQEEVRVLRLIPVTNLLRNLPRVLRDLSHDLGKKVEFEITDNDAKIDKMVLEGIKDPITHILRNALDHGLEDTETRKRQGKPETGRIKIDVKEEGNQVIFIISDDGAGINIEKIAEKAIQKNFIAKADLETMSQDEIIGLIFRPGFSTKDIITDISGRGVGLDVVKANLVNLRGHVSVTTVIGQGTTFSLRVPLTLATERGLIVSCSEQLFVITTSSVERVLLLNKKDIIDLEKSQAILLDNHPVSLCVLADILNFPNMLTGNEKQFPVIVIRKGQNLAALLVDEIIGEREIVIKPLKAPLINVPCVSGATLAGSGEIIIVLNITELVERALNSRRNVIIGVAPAANQDLKKRSLYKTNILVVDDSLTTGNFVKNVFSTKGYKVSLAVDGREAWELMQKEKYDIVITDIEMPGINGVELTEKIRASSTLHETPVIVVTSMESEEQRQKSMAAGADAFLLKTKFESSELLKIVSDMVSA